jgi:alpha-glucosidase
MKDAHALGIRIIVDLVPNHSSDQQVWFQEALAAAPGSAERERYMFREGKGEHGELAPNDWESIFGGPAWTRVADGQWYLHLFAPEQPDLNWENPEVREAINEMVRWWLDKGIDGFRLDAVSHMKKVPGLPDLPNPEGCEHVPSWAMHMNIEGVLEYMDDLARNSFRHYDIMTVGEANGVSAEQAKDWVGAGHQRLNMIFQFEHLALWAQNPKAGLDLVALKKIFSHWQETLDGIGWNALFLENHDIPRIVSKWGDPEHYWRESATALATMYFLMQGTPFIYQGQEIGMTNTRFDGIEDFDCIFARNDFAQQQAKGIPTEEILAAISPTARDHSRTPMQWDDSANAGFSTGQPWLKTNPNYLEINVARQEADPDSVLKFYRRLIALRRAEPVLVHGRYALLMADDPQIYAYTRSLDGRRIVVIANLSGAPAEFAEPGLTLDDAGLLLANHTVAPHTDTERLALRPFEARVYRLN